MPEKRKVRRSGLTMPVVTARFLDNAWRRGCDFINLDLEDSVPQRLKVVGSCGCPNRRPRK